MLFCRVVFFFRAGAVHDADEDDNKECSFFLFAYPLGFDLDVRFS